jgi:hypothetical protein
MDLMESGQSAPDSPVGEVADRFAGLDLGDREDGQPLLVLIVQINKKGGSNDHPSSSTDL